MLKGLIVLLGFCISGLMQAQDVNKIKFYTENFPPYNFLENKTQVKGISVDILVEMLNYLKSTSTRDSIKVLPWARGYNYALTKKNSCLFSTTRTPGREKLFKWVGPIAPIRIGLVHFQDVKIGPVTSLKDLATKRLRVAVIKEDIGQQLLIEKGFPADKMKVFYGVDAIPKALKMVSSGRLPSLWSYDPNVAQWEAKKLGFPGKIEMAYELTKSHLYFAFHKETSDLMIDRYQKALDDVRKSGKVQEILNRYIH